MNTGKLWAGGVATALVAALTAVVGYMIVENILDIAFVTPALGQFGGSQISSLALHAAIAALVATGLAQLLYLGTPRALSFFTWIAGLVTAVVVLWPFTIDTTIQSKVASALVYLVVGIAIISLVGGVARSAVRPAEIPPGRPDPRGYDQRR